MRKEVTLVIDNFVGHKHEQWRTGALNVLMNDYIKHLSIVTYITLLVILVIATEA